jgi:hypothetical protein
VLLIGNGSGGTPYAAGVNSKTEHIRVIEIVQPVYSVMKQFAAVSADSALRGLIADRRIERVVGDGRHFLYTDGTRYDVVQADAILPWSSHAGLLYSVEFFREVQARLKDDGVYVQWVPTERTLASFLAVFPYVVQLNKVLIGSNRPIAYSRDMLEAKLKGGEVRKYLSAANWDPDFILNWLTEKPERIWSPSDKRTDNDVNTDLFPKDEYFLNRRKLSYMR